MYNNLNKAWSMVNKTTYTIQTMNKLQHINHLKASDMLKDMEVMYNDIKYYNAMKDLNTIHHNICLVIIDNILELIEYRYNTIKSLNS